MLSFHLMSRRRQHLLDRDYNVEPMGGQEQRVRDALKNLDGHLNFPLSSPSPLHRGDVRICEEMHWPRLTD